LVEFTHGIERFGAGGNADPTFAMNLYDYYHSREE
jgi:hypothetical protein